MKENKVEGEYGRLYVNLELAENQGYSSDDPKEFRIYGNYIQKVEYTGDVKDAGIRIGHKHAPRIPVSEFSKIIKRFDKIYIDGSDTSGTLILNLGFVGNAEIHPEPSKRAWYLLEVAQGAIVVLLTAIKACFKSHTTGSLKVTLSTLDTAQKLSATSIKVRWAVISSKAYPFMLGTSTVKQSTDIGNYFPAGTDVVIELCDLSEIYFVDGDGVNKPVLQILYIEEA